MDDLLVFFMADSVSFSDISFLFNLSIWPSRTGGFDFVVFPFQTRIALRRDFCNWVFNIPPGSIWLSRREITRTQVFADRMF